MKAEAKLIIFMAMTFVAITIFTPYERFQRYAT